MNDNHDFISAVIFSTSSEKVGHDTPVIHRQLTFSLVFATLAGFLSLKLHLDLDKTVFPLCCRYFKKRSN